MSDENNNNETDPHSHDLHAHDIMEHGDLDADAGLEDFDTGGKTTLAEAWKTNPVVKIAGVAGIIAVLIGGVTLFGGEKKTPVMSTVTTSATGFKEAPGGKVSPVMANALQEANDQAVEKAQREGTSALPVPIGPSRGRVETEAGKDSGEDPLERWRRIQEERLKKEQAVTPVAAAPAPPRPVDPYAQDKQNLATSMQTQMQSILQSMKKTAPKKLDVSPDDYMDTVHDKEAKKPAAIAKAAGVDAAKTQKTVRILIPAGKIEYGQLINTADSDTPGPVLVQLSSGPLAGDRMIGTFRTQNEYLTLTFDSLVHNGVALNTQAVALDPDTSLPGLQTDVDHKYFARIVLPAAGAFITGMGGAIADSQGTSVTLVQGAGAVATQPSLDTKQEFFKGVQAGAQQASQVLTQDGQQEKVEVTVAAGTAVGLLFTQPVQEKIGGDTATSATNSAPTGSASQLLSTLGQQGAQTTAAPASASTSITPVTPTPVTTTPGTGIIGTGIVGMPGGSGIYR